MSRMRLTSLEARRRAARTCLRAVARGSTLRAAAEAAGFHVATICRWRHTDPKLQTLFRIVLRACREARKLWRLRQTALERLSAEFHCLVNSWPPERLEKIARRRPRVGWSRRCPLCGRKVVIRTAGGRWRFWRCSRWPECSFASWRPRALQDCPACGAPCFWSRSRKSIACSRCGTRMRTVRR